jgi:predicted tellurium resistance membrane protein TerC
MSESRTGGIGFFGLLTIVFITLKLTDYIDWSWWWVLSPLWIPLAIIFAILVIMLVMGARVRQRRKR